MLRRRSGRRCSSGTPTRCISADCRARVDSMSQEYYRARGVELRHRMTRVLARLHVRSARRRHAVARSRQCATSRCAQLRRRRASTRSLAAELVEPCERTRRSFLERSVHSSLTARPRRCVRASHASTCVGVARPVSSRNARCSEATWRASPLERFRCHSSSSSLASLAPGLRDQAWSSTVMPSATFGASPRLSVEELTLRIGRRMPPRARAATRSRSYRGSRVPRCPPATSECLSEVEFPMRELPRTTSTKSTNDSASADARSFRAPRAPRVA